MITEWRGQYLDGLTPSRRAVAITCKENGLSLSAGPGQPVFWPYEEISQTQGFYEGEQVRLEKTGPDRTQILLVSNPLFLPELRKFAPKPTAHFKNPARAGAIFRSAIFGIAGILILSVYIYFQGFPAMASLITGNVPTAWETELGNRTLGEIPASAFCHDVKKQKALDQILSLLTRALPPNPYSFLLHVMNTREMNAFALPGGNIIVFNGLLQKSDSPEELAGVLAHELQHIVLRHSTRQILQGASFRLLLSSFSGFSFGLNAAETLGSLNYSRQFEEEADRNGMALLLAANIDPSGMISFFEKLQKQERKGGGTGRFLSDHPLTEDRIEVLKSLARLPAKPVRILPEWSWKKISHYCERDSVETQE